MLCTAIIYLDTRANAHTLTPKHVSANRRFRRMCVRASVRRSRTYDRHNVVVSLFIITHARVCECVCVLASARARALCRCTAIYSCVGIRTHAHADQRTHARTHERRHHVSGVSDHAHATRTTSHNQQTHSSIRAESVRPILHMAAGTPAIALRSQADK